MYFREMKLLRRILSPLRWIYAALMSIRNGLFKFGFLVQYKSTIPVISIGNLSMGGTGKTPHIIFLINRLKQNKIAVLSRGYGRKIKNLIDGDISRHSIKDIGDEPYELLEKFDSENFQVIVNANRKQALNYLEKQETPPGIVLLDDGFQHRYVQRDLNILLTDIQSPFYSDKVFPAGNLRENIEGAERADLIIVTKCPKELSSGKQTIIKKKIETFSKAAVYFSCIRYQGFKNKENLDARLITNGKYLLITSIAFTKSIEDHLYSNEIYFEHLTYKDHHNFSKNEIKEIAKKSTKFVGIITTEKDWMRLRESDLHKKTQTDIYRLQIEIELLHSDEQFMKRLNEIN